MAIAYTIISTHPPPRPSSFLLILRHLAELGIARARDDDSRAKETYKNMLCHNRDNSSGLLIRGSLNGYTCRTAIENCPRAKQKPALYLRPGDLGRGCVFHLEVDRNAAVSTQPALDVNDAHRHVVFQPLRPVCVGPSWVSDTITRGQKSTPRRVSATHEAFTNEGTQPFGASW